MYGRDPIQVKILNETSRNPKYFSEFELNKLIVADTNLDTVLQDAKAIFLTIPAQCIPDWLAENKHRLSSRSIICNTAKGLYLKDKKLLSEAVDDVLRDQQYSYAILSGEFFIYKGIIFIY